MCEYLCLSCVHNLARNYHRIFIHEACVHFCRPSKILQLGPVKIGQRIIDSSRFLWPRFEKKSFRSWKWDKGSPRKSGLCFFYASCTFFLHREIEAKSWEKLGKQILIGGSKGAIFLGAGKKGANWKGARVKRRHQKRLNDKKAPPKKASG